ncbi:GrpE nucleotide exchange factor [Macleaya cordata]|uniref:GrpE protein homolog n=1 Tax=Macleaya cordata TaxID=56857 RepID=A0A200QTI8_MACCD|nr:GrpE nucleotide exchange factor [Macleaya cordata]
MATVLRTPAFLQTPTALSTTSLETPKRLFCLSFRNRPTKFGSPLKLSNLFKSNSVLVPKFITFAAHEEVTETTDVEEAQTQESSDDEVPLEDLIDGAIPDVEEKSASVIVASLESYKEALANNDESKVAEIEALLQSIEEEKMALANQVKTLIEELASVRDRTLRISADFDNFRKRTERERLSLVTNVQGEVVESLLPVLDNFERAKSQIKAETEAEEKINNSYQSIYKQFVEILGSLGVVPVETVGNPFDPLLHEAIMREDSEEFEEGIILQEFRKGFKLGERLLRPAMVKVSAGPGPAKPKEPAVTSEDAEVDNETSEEDSSAEGESA